MKYQELRKLYYGKQEVYAQAYASRFDSEEAIKLDFFVANKQAFFLENVEVLQMACKIEKLDKAVCKLSMSLPGVAKEQYSKKCLIDEIVLTNKIEGVHSSRKEIGEALDLLEKQSSEKGKTHQFLSLINKYLKLLTGEDVPLTNCQDIRAIYDEILLGEIVAEDPKNAPDGKIFRKELAEIHSATDKVIHKGLMPESSIIEAMEKALAFLNDDSVEHLYRICVFHYLFEYIHPFYDGNGRLGRFILSYCLSEIMEPLLAYRISETIKENINAYYNAFEVCNDPRNLGDLTPFLLMLLNMIASALQDLKDSLTRKLTSWKKYESLVESFPQTNQNTRKMYSYLIQAALFSEKGISTDELKTQFQGSYYTVKKILEQIPSELLISDKKGREKYYQLSMEKLDGILLEKELQKVELGEITAH